MTKYEFLSGLKEALENSLDSAAVQENVSYYRTYIDSEIANGRSEQDVLNELGDPWVIATSVIEMAESKDVYADGYSDSYSENYTGQNESKVRVFSLGSWWKKILFILGVIGVFLIIFAVIGGVITLLAPLVMPALVIICVLRLFRRRQ